MPAMAYTGMRGGGTADRRLVSREAELERIMVNLAAVERAGGGYVQQRAGKVPNWRHDHQLS